MKFSIVVNDAVRSYVYGLVDPRDETLFYIGKGGGDRVFAHASGKLPEVDPSYKMDLITKIKAEGKEVRHLILRHGLSDEEAIIVESTLIDFCRYVEGARLTNAVHGHGATAFGVMTTDAIIRKYDAPMLAEMEPDCMLININKKYKRTSDTNEIYQATRRAWIIAKWRRDTVKCALAEYKGLIVGVFDIEHWTEDSLKKNTGKPDRYAFEGKSADGARLDRYLNRRVYKGGSPQNPIRFNLPQSQEPDSAAA